MPIANTPSGQITYRDLGAPDAEPLLFVHGLLVDGRLWEGVADRLSANYRCIVPDWPLGSHRTAMSPDADLSPPGMAEVIVSFMDELSLDRVTLVGNDSGGAISQILTAAHPERVERLVLTNCDMLENFPPFPFNLMAPLAKLPGGMAALVTPFRIPAVGRFTFNMLVKHPIDAALVDSWLEPSIKDQGVRRDTHKLIVGVNKRQTLAAAEGLRTFERPIRFVWAPEDGFFKRSDAERLAAMVPDAGFVDIADAKTFSPLDQPSAVADGIASVVAEPAPA